MVSNRMARFTCQEGFPDPEALFEVQIKAVQGDSVSIEAGTISYGCWCEPSCHCTGEALSLLWAETTHIWAGRTTSPRARPQCTPTPMVRW
jgi:hypothetical protein